MSIKNKRINKKYSYQNLSLQDINGEAWRDIKGFEDYYMVSNTGRVKSLARKIWVEQRARYYSVKEKILSQKITASSNLCVKLSIRQDNIRVTPLVSRLVAQAFICEDIDNKYVLHKNKDIFNNSLEKLYVADRDELSNYNYSKMGDKFSSKYRGVSQRKGVKNYIMRFYYRKKLIEESFKTEIEAAKRYDYYIKKFNLKRVGNFI